MHFKTPACVTVWAVLLIGAPGARFRAAQPPGQDHLSDYAQADIEYGSRIYSAQCLTCHGATGDSVAGVDLRLGKFRTVSTDQELTRIIATGVPGKGMPSFRFDAAENAGVVAYLRNMNQFDPSSIKTGDPVRGRATFEGRGGCTACHRVNRQGSYAGPNLSEIGAVRSAGSLQRSLLDPTSQMMPINRPVRVVTRDGTVINGRRLNEDTYTVQLVDERARLRSLAKADLREYAVLTTSPMPSYREKLTSEEFSDLLTYLLTLKGS